MMYISCLVFVLSQFCFWKLPAYPVNLVDEYTARKYTWGVLRYKKVSNENYNHYFIHSSFLLMY